MKTHRDPTQQQQQRATMITAGVGVNSSLLLEPAHQLTFWLDAPSPHDSNKSNKSGVVPRAALKLTNISARKLAVFKVRTNNADMFTVKPVHGVIAPGESLEIVVSVVAASAARLATIPSKELATRDSERFLIQSVEQSEDMRGFDTSDLVAFWKRVPRELATNSKIGCRFMVLRSCRSHPALVMDTISKSPQPTVKQLVVVPPQPQQEQESTPEDEPNQLQPQRRRLSSLEPGDVDKTIDVRQARRRRSSSSGAQAQAHEQEQAQEQEQEPKPDTFEFSVSDESNLNPNLNLKAVAPAAASAPALNAPPPPKALFSIHPSDTVEFKVKPGATGRATLNPASFFLTNKSRLHALAFKVKTTNHEGYFVKPSRGLIGPSNAQRIEILPVYHETQSARGDNNSAAAILESLQQREAKDRFMVEIVRVDIANYQELLNLDERVRKRELVTVWDSAEPSCREKAMMSCRILDTPSVAIKNNKDAPHDKGNQDKHDMWC